MVGITHRSVALGLIGALALIAMACVPVYGQHERGPTIYTFTTANNCTGPSVANQYFPNATLDLGMGVCVNTSTGGGSDDASSLRWKCQESGSFIVTYYHDTGDCTGYNTFTEFATNLCFPGDFGTKRDAESQNPFEKYGSSKRVEGDVSTLYVCNPGESFTLVDNTPVDMTAPVIDSPNPVACYSPGNCTAGTTYATLYNSTDRAEPTCDQALQSVAFISGAIVGDCYLGPGFNLRVGCSSDSFFYDVLPYGCDGSWIIREGQFTGLPHDQCTRVQGDDTKFFCPTAVGQPITPPPPSSASLQSPHLFLFFLSIAFIAAISLF